MSVEVKKPLRARFSDDNSEQEQTPAVVKALTRLYGAGFWARCSEMQSECDSYGNEVEA